MSEETTFLKPIYAPGLKSANYGSNIKDQFNNIDENFKKIVGSDFLKGLQGDSIILKELDFSRENWDEHIYLKFNHYSGVEFFKLTPGILKKAIINAIDYNIKNGLDNWQYEYAFATIPEENNKYDLTPISYLEYLGVNESSEYNNSKITVICATDEATQKNYIVSSLPFIFYDARFSKISYEVLNDYNDVVDTSCVIYFDPSKYSLDEEWGKYIDIYNHPELQLNELISNLAEHCMCAVTSFPTLYYDQDTIYDEDSTSRQMGTFCWKINGQKTGIPANGPRGPHGSSNPGLIVKVANYPSNKFGPNGKKLYPVISAMINAGTNQYPDVKFVKIDDIINGVDINGNKLYENVDLIPNSLTLAFKTVNDNTERDLISDGIPYYVYITAPTDNDFAEEWLKNEWNLTWKFTFNDGSDASDYVETTLLNNSTETQRVYKIQKKCTDVIKVLVYPTNPIYKIRKEKNYDEDALGYGYSSINIGKKLDGYTFDVKQLDDYDLEINPNINIVSINYNDIQSDINRLYYPVQYAVTVTKNGEFCSGDYMLSWKYSFVDNSTGNPTELDKVNNFRFKDNNGNMVNMIGHTYMPASKKYIIKSYFDHDILAAATPYKFKDKFDEITWYLNERIGVDDKGNNIIYNLPSADLIHYIKSYPDENTDSFVDKCWVSPLVQYEYKDSHGKSRYEYYVECDDYNSIMNTFESHAMINYMLSLGKSAHNPGLILPMTNNQNISYLNNEEKIPGHLLFTEGIDGNRADMIIAPLDNVLLPFNIKKNQYKSKNNSLSIWHNKVYIGKNDGEKITGYDNDLIVAGNSEINGGLNVHGVAELGITNIKDKLSTKDVSIGGKLTANSDVEIKGIFTSLGNTIINDNININGPAVFNNTIKVKETLTIEPNYNEDTSGYNDGISTQHVSLLVNGIANFNNKIISQNIIPDQKDKRMLGNGNARWNYIWANTINCKKLTIEGQELDNDLNKTQKLQIVSDVSDEVIAEISSKNNNAYLSVTGPISYKDQYGETANINTISSVPLSSIISLLLPSGDVVTETPDKCYKLNLTGSTIMDAVDPNVRFEVYDETTKTWKSDSEAGYSLADIKFTVIDESGNIINNGFITENWQSSLYKTYYDWKPGQSVFVNIYVNKPIRFTIVATNGTSLQARQTRITFAESIKDHMSHNLVTYGSVGEISFNAASSASYILP